MATALISALTRRPVRHDTAMTGEITLRGRVLAIGGLKEKALAAHRHGVRRVIAPKENQRDFAKLPMVLKREVTFIWASSMDDVVAESLVEDQQDRVVMNLAIPLPGMTEIVPEGTVTDASGS